MQIRFLHFFNCTLAKPAPTIEFGATVRGRTAPFDAQEVHSVDLRALPASGQEAACWEITRIASRRSDVGRRSSSSFPPVFNGVRLGLGFSLSRCLRQFLGFPFVRGRCRMLENCSLSIDVVLVVSHGR